ncbi:MAG: AMP-binding protein [Desulfobacterales bacterium]|nr:AMP-binding protein [Desulfobacterales bacterium]
MGKPTLYSQQMIDEYRSKGYWTAETFADLYDQRAREHPDREAIVDAKARFTWREIKQWTDRVALGLLDAGYKKNDILVVHLPNWAEIPLFRIACEKAGIVSMAVPWALRHKEMEYILKETRASGIVITRKFHQFDYFKMTADIRPALPGLRHVLVVGDDVPPGAVSVTEMSERPLEGKYPSDYLDRTKFGAFEYSWIQLTSGSTGFPKFVEAPICGKIYSGKMFLKATRLTGDDVCGIFALGPVGPNLTGNMGSPQVGAKMALLERFTPEEALRFIEKEKITLLGVVPTMLSKMIEAPDFDSYDLKSLRAVIVTGSPLPPSLAEAAEEKMGPIVQYYGSVDFGGISLPYIDVPRNVRLHTSNRLCPGTQAKLIDEQGKEAAPGRAGELAVRGPACNAGYYKDPETTWKTWAEDGWFRTGDLATFDEEGYLLIVGRIKDVIIRGGQNINPAEVENLLMEHPKVTGAALVGMPDAVMGEKACAYVVLNPGEALAFDEMVAFLREKNIAAYKLPERLEILQQLPLVPGSGKVNKKLLAEAIAEKLRDEKNATKLRCEENAEK